MQEKIKHYLLGGIIGLCSAFAMLLIFAAVLTFTGLDRAFAIPFSTISIAIGSFTAALYSAKKIGDKGYLVGLITGTAVFCLITLISVIINHNGLTSNSVFRLVIIILASTVGGIIGVNKDKKKKYI